MRLEKKFLTMVSVCICLAMAGCATRIVETTEIGAPDAAGRVLIATDVTDFKTEVIERVYAAFSDEPIYFKLIDVRNLEKESASAYDAVVLLNTCLVWSVNSNVREFVQDNPDTRKIFVITTAGDPAWEPDITGVDAITAASDPNLADRLAELIVLRIKAKL